MTIASSTASSEFLKNPYSFYDTLRAVHPIYKGSFLKYPGWYVTGYEETVAILKDARFKVRTPGRLRARPNIRTFHMCKIK